MAAGEVKTLRIGIAGSGFGKSVLLPVFASLEGVETVALAGSRDADPTAMFAGLDAIVLAIPPRVQERVALAAVERGLPIFCEKPLALDHDAAVKIGDACARRKVVGVVDFELRKWPVFRSLREHATQLGPLRKVWFDWIVQAHNKPVVPASWKYDAAEGGGAMSSFGCHLVDCCSALLGKLEVMEYRPRTQIRRRETGHSAVKITAEDEFELRLKSATGARAVICVNTVAPTHAGLKAVIQGRNGKLVLEDDQPDNFFSGFTLRHIGLDSQARIAETFPSKDAGQCRADAVREVAKEFVRAIREGGPVDCGIEIGVENTRLISHARKMARARRPSS